MCFGLIKHSHREWGISDVFQIGLHANEQGEWVFEKSGDMWENANMIMQAWTFGLGGEPGMKGWDVLVVGGGGKVESLYAMIEGVSSSKW